MHLFASPEQTDLSERSGVLDYRERERWLSLRRSDDRRRYLVAHIALRDILAERLGLDAGHVRLGNDPCPVCGSGDHGRPISLDDPAGTHWSISHTSGLVAVAVGPVPLGIDVESVDAAGDTGFLDEVGTHPDDAASIGSSSASLDPTTIARVRLARWTRLEAVLKSTGAGLGIDPATVAVGVGGRRTLSTPSPPIGAVHEPDATGAGQSTVCDLEVGIGHVGALAVSGSDMPELVVRWI